MVDKVRRVELRAEFQVEASHRMIGYTGPKCGKLHGHSYAITVEIEGPIQTDGPHRGMVIDFHEVERVVMSLDHQDLNDLPQFRAAPGASAEMIGLWLVDEIERLGSFDHVAVEVEETRGNSVRVETVEE